MTRRPRAQQDGPSLLDELDELDVAEAPLDAPVTIRPARPRKPAPVVAVDEVTVILERVRAERERLEHAIAAARHRIDQPEETTDRER